SSHSPHPTLTPPLLFFFFYCSAHHRDLHSFPTRRSSDLDRSSRQPGRDRGCAFAAATRQLRGRRATQSGCPHSWRGHPAPRGARSEEHTSELQSLTNLVCRLLLEKKNTHTRNKDHRRHTN